MCMRPLAVTHAPATGTGGRAHTSSSRRHRWRIVRSASELRSRKVSMHSLTKHSIAIAAVATALALVPATAASASGRGGDHAVFVQTVEPGGNHIVAYHRGDDGQLSAAGTYDTGGAGVSEVGAVVDPLASQG